MQYKWLCLIPFAALCSIVPKEDLNPPDYVYTEAPKGGSVVFPHLKYPNTFHPHPWQKSPYPGLSLVYETLIEKTDIEDTYSTLLANKISEKADYVIIKLDQNAHFSNRAIESDDVVYSFTTFSKHAHHQLKTLLAKVTLQAINKSVLSVHYGIAKEDLWLLLSVVPILPKGHDIEKPPIGTGPYLFIQQDAGHIQYQRNPKYWAIEQKKGYYNFDNISYRFYPSTHAISTAFRNHEVDYYLEYSAQNWGLEKGGKDLSYTTLAHPTQVFHQMLWHNQNRAPLDNKNIRKAIAVLIDPEFINQWFFENQYNTPPSCEKNMRERLLMAANYLDKEGWKMKKGYRYKHGKKLVIRLISHHRNLDPVFQLLKSHCQRVGITLEVDLLEKHQFFLQKAKGEYHLILYPIIIDQHHKSLKDMRFLQQYDVFPKLSLLYKIYPKLPSYLAYPVYLSVIKSLKEEYLLTPLWSIDHFRIGYQQKLHFVHTEKPFIDLNTWWIVE